MLSFITSSPKLFNVFIKSEKVSVSVKLFVNHVVHHEKVAKSCFMKHIAAKKGFVKKIVKIYRKVSKPKQKAISRFFKARLHWFPSPDTFSDLKNIAEIIGESREIDFKQIMTTWRGPAISFQSKEPRVSIKTLLASLLTHDWALEPQMNSYEAKVAGLDQKFKALIQRFQAYPERPRFRLGVLVEYLSQSLDLDDKDDAEDLNDIIDFSISHNLHRDFLHLFLEAGAWMKAALIIRKTLSLQSFYDLVKIDSTYYSNLLSKKLFKSKLRPKNLRKFTLMPKTLFNSTLFDIYNLAKHSEIQSAIPLTNYLRNLLMEPFIDTANVSSSTAADMANTTIITPLIDGDFILAKMPDEVLSSILFCAVDNFAHLELVLKRVCKRWTRLLVDKEVIMRSPPMMDYFVRLLESKESVKKMWELVNRTAGPDRISFLLSLYANHPIDWRRFDLPQFVDSFCNQKPSPVQLAQLVKLLANNISSDSDSSDTDSDSEPKHPESMEWLSNFPKSFNSAQICEFINELDRDGKYPANFIALPRLSALMLDALKSNEKSVPDYAQLTRKIISQTFLDNHRKLALLLEHYVLGWYSLETVQLITGEKTDLTEMIINVARKLDLCCIVNLDVLFARFIARMLLNNDPHPDLSEFHERIKNIIMYAAMLEARSAKEFKTLLPFINKVLELSGIDARVEFKKAVTQFIENGKLH